MKIFIIPLLLSVFLTFPSVACLHYSNSDKIKITEGLQEFFVYHDGTNAHMILRTQLSAKKFPHEIAWVLPFPSLPSKYQEVDGPLFQELSQLFASNDSTSKGRGTLGAHKKTDGSGGGIAVHEMVQAGDFQIQPIEILKDNSGQELNSWLSKNKFNTMPLSKQKRYLKKGAAFLAIRMKMNRPGEAELLSRPLHVTYLAEEVSVPMLFTHEDRTFDLDIYVFSQKEMKHDLSKLYLDRLGSVSYKREHQRPMIENLIGDRSGWITRYSAKDLNTKAKKLSQLARDPAFLKADL